MVISESDKGNLRARKVELKTQKSNQIKSMVLPANLIKLVQFFLQVHVYTESNQPNSTSIDFILVNVTHKQSSPFQDQAIMLFFLSSILTVKNSILKVDKWDDRGSYIIHHPTPTIWAMFIIIIIFILLYFILLYILIVLFLKECYIYVFFNLKFFFLF
jgi:hypothetical protein